MKNCVFRIRLKNIISSEKEKNNFGKKNKSKYHLLQVFTKAYCCLLNLTIFTFICFIHSEICLVKLFFLKFILILNSIFPRTWTRLKIQEMILLRPDFFKGNVCKKWKGYKLTAKNKRLWSLLILLLSVVSKAENC